MIGLYEKYIILKPNGEPLDPEAKYFVLRYDNDIDALYAAIMWAVRKENWELVDDLQKETKDVEAKRKKEEL